MIDRTITPELQPPWRIGVDIGGTFTDLVLVDARGTMSVGKALSTSDDPARAVVAGLQQLAAQLSLNTRQLLQGCEHFVHASTVATNIVLERSAAPVGMLVTNGFRDSIAIRRGIRPNPWAHRNPFPPVLSPRYLRIPVRGRIDRDGQVIEPLSEEDIAAGLAEFKREQVRSIAVCFYNSYLNPAHEYRAGEIIRHEYPDCLLSLSSEIAPTMGEYERSSTAVLNAYIAPKMIAYLKRLAAALKELGLGAPLLLVQSNGGSLTIPNAERRPVSLLLSGPAAGAGALSLYPAAVGSPNLICMEIGGTSCDVMLTTGKGADTTNEFELGGYHVAVPSIQIHSIGAGGGTIAGVDRSGMLFAGPWGAGAHPGPAAYARGGENPTLTDVQLVLGRLKEGALSGDICLRADLAAQSIDSKIGRVLGLSTVAAAVGILRLIEQDLLHAAQKITAEKGHDPSKFTLVAAGGAGPMHGASIGRKLRCSAVYVPRQAGTFCAMGMLNVPIRHELVSAFPARLRGNSVQKAEIVFRQLEALGTDQLISDGFHGPDVEIRRELDLRHPGQVGAIQLDVPPRQAGIDAAAVSAGFLAAHRKLYGYADPSAEIEIVNLRVVAIGRFSSLRLDSSPSREGVPERSTPRDVFFEEAEGFVSTDVFHGSAMFPGARFHGPAIVEEQTMTIVVGPKDSCRVDGFGNYVIELH